MVTISGETTTGCQGRKATITKEEETVVYQDVSPLTEEQLTGMDIWAIRRDLDYIIPGLFLELRKLKGDGNQHNRFSSFDYTRSELDDYAGSQLKLMIENDDGEYFSCFKHLKAHVMPMVSGLNLQVAEM